MTEDEEKLFPITEVLAGLRGVDEEVLDRWMPDEGCSWSCIECDYWTPDNPPPDICPRCGFK